MSLDKSSKRKKLTDCDQRLAKYRQAVEAGAEATVVAGWMAEVRGERLRAEGDLVAATPHDPLTKEEVRTMVLEARDIASVLIGADPDLKQTCTRRTRCPGPLRPV